MKTSGIIHADRGIKKDESAGTARGSTDLVHLLGQHASRPCNATAPAHKAAGGRGKVPKGSQRPAVSDRSWTAAGHNFPEPRFPDCQSLTLLAVPPMRFARSVP